MHRLVRRKKKRGIKRLLYPSCFAGRLRSTLARCRHFFPHGIHKVHARFEYRYIVRRDLHGRVGPDIPSRFLSPAFDNETAEAPQIIPTATARRCPSTLWIYASNTWKGTTWRCSAVPPLLSASACGIKIPAATRSIAPSGTNRGEAAARGAISAITVSLPASSR